MLGRAKFLSWGYNVIVFELFLKMCSFIIKLKMSTCWIKMVSLLLMKSVVIVFVKFFSFKIIWNCFLRIRGAQETATTILIQKYKIKLVYWPLYYPLTGHSDNHSQEIKLFENIMKLDLMIVNINNAIEIWLCSQRSDNNLFNLK